MPQTSVSAGQLGFRTRDVTKSDMIGGDVLGPSGLKLRSRETSSREIQILSTGNGFYSLSSTGET
jgi:hypothetical protein